MKTLLFGCLAGVMLLGGCREREAPAAATTTPPPATDSAPSTVAPTVSDMTATEIDTKIPIGHTELFDRVEVGSARGGDRSINPSKFTFKAGETILVNVRLREVPPALVARVGLFDKKGKPAYDDTRPAAKQVEFDIDQTHAVPAGEYEMRVWLGGNEVHTAKVVVEK